MSTIPTAADTKATFFGGTSLYNTRHVTLYTARRRLNTGFFVPEFQDDATLPRAEQMGN